MAKRVLVVTMMNGTERRYADHDDGPDFQHYEGDFNFQDIYRHSYEVTPEGHLVVTRARMRSTGWGGEWTHFNTEATEQTAFIPAGGWQFAEWQNA